MKEIELEGLLANGAKTLGLDLSDEAISNFMRYREELKAWNQKFNLTSVDDDKQIIIRHFLDSLTIANFLKGTKRILDVGSGAGFPGIPLKLALPDLKIVLMDSIQKKVGFLKHIIELLDLKNIDAVALRAQDKNTIKLYEAAFDCVTSRALTALPDFIDMALPFIGTNGTIIAIKGPKATEEVKDIRPKAAKQVSPPELIHVSVPFSDRTNIIVVCRKLPKTS